MTNTVELNLPSNNNKDDRPDPKKPFVSLNGVPIANLVSFSMSVDASSMTKCNISFYATVEGKFAIEDEHLKFGTREDISK